jgi:hypothetical protein
MIVTGRLVDSSGRGNHGSIGGATWTKREFGAGRWISMVLARCSAWPIRRSWT